MLSYNGTNLDQYGITAVVSKTRQPDPPPPARPSLYQTTLELRSRTLDNGRAQVWQRLSALESALSVPEADLVVDDESGHSRTYRAVLFENNIGDVIRARGGEMRVRFRYTEPVDPAHGTNAAVFQLPGKQSITLTHVRNWRESINTDFADPDHDARLRTVATITFSARVTIPHLTEAFTPRRDAIFSERVNQLARLLKGNAGTLTYSNFSESVKITSVAHIPSNDAHFADLEITATYVRWPDGDTARVDYRATPSQDKQTGAISLDVSGTITARTEAEADAAQLVILQKYANGTRKLLRDVHTDREFQAGPHETKWLSRSFQYVFENQSAGYSGYSLRISTTTDSDTGRKTITYSGSVTAETYLTALAKAQTLAANKHPILKREHLEQNVSSLLDDVSIPGNEFYRFLSLEFEYQYEAEPAADFIAGEVTYAQQAPVFGLHSETLSGHFTGGDVAFLRTKAQELLGDRLEDALVCHLSDKREDESQKVYLENQTLSRFTFIYTLSRHRGDGQNTGITYDREVSVDNTEFTKRIAITGQIFAGSEAQAEAQVDYLVVTEGLRPLVRNVRHQYEHNAALSPCYRSSTFSLTFEDDITGTPGFDVIEAEYTIERISQIPIGSVHMVIGGPPVTQAATTVNVGTLTVSGHAIARTAAGAKAWGQSKRSLATFHGSTAGTEQPPRESLRHMYKRFKTGTPSRYQFNFTYSAQFGRWLNPATSNIEPVLSGLM